MSKEGIQRVGEERAAAALRETKRVMRVAINVRAV